MADYFSVVDFGARGNASYSAGTPPTVNGTDDTEAFQRAIDAAQYDGGGIVSVPGGYYKLSGHLVLREDIKLVGENVSRNGWIHTSWTSGIKQGSVLMPLETGSTPFIDMQHKNAAIEGLTIFYGQQYEPAAAVRGTADWISGSATLTNVTACQGLTAGDKIRNDADSDGEWYEIEAKPARDTVTLTSPYIGSNIGAKAYTAFAPYAPTAYPWTIRGGVFNDDCDNVIRNVLLVNPYKAFRFDTKHSSRFTIENVVCGALHRGLLINYATEVNVFNNIHFQTYRTHKQGNDEQLAVQAYTLANLTAIEIGRADNFVMNDILIIYANKGIVLNRETCGERVGSWGCISNLLLDVVETGIEANYINQTHGIAISNFAITSPEKGPYWTGSSTGITAGPDNVGSLQLANGMFSGTKFDRHIEWSSGEAETQPGLLVTNCNFFHHGSSLQEPFDSIVVKAGKANIGNCHFIGDFGRASGTLAIRADSVSSRVYASGNCYNENLVGGVGTIGVEQIPTGLVMNAVDPSVGIGTLDPRSLLHIAASAPGAVGGNLIVDNPSNTLDAGAAMDFYSSNNTPAAYPAARIRTYHKDGTVSSEDDELRVATRQGGTLAEVLAIAAGGDVGIGTTSPNSKLHVDGSAALGFAGLSGATTLDSSHCVVQVTAPGDTTLPTASGTAGRMYAIKNTSGTRIAVAPSPQEKIDGVVGGQHLSNNQSLTLVCDGIDGWLTIAKYSPEAEPVAELVREGEAGDRVGAFTVGADTASSGGEFVHVPKGFGTRYDGPDENHRVEYRFTLTEPGRYRIRGWVHAVNGESDSFWVKVDGSPMNGYLWDTLQNTDYRPDHVRDRDGDHPVELQLEPGAHTVTLYLREDGTRLDRIELEPVAE